MDDSNLIRADIILDAANLGNTLSGTLDASILRLHPLEYEAKGCCVVAGGSLDHDSGPPESTLRKDVIAFSSKVETIQMQMDYPTVEINRQDIFSLPNGMSKETAVVHLAALSQAASIIAPKLGLIPEDIGKAPRAHSKLGRVIVVGGETPLGAAIVQVLSKTLESPRINVTAVMEDQEELFQRVTHLMALGAIYAIDGAFPDLKDHLGTIRDEDCQVIVIKATADYEIRSEVLKAVRGRSTILRCDTLDSQDKKFTDLPDSAPFRSQMHELLEQAAKAFAIYEPPPSCGFDQAE